MFQVLKKVIFLVPFLFSCAVPEPSVEPVETPHLFLVYMAASNNLESYGLSDFEELEEGLEASSEDGVVLVLMDRIQDGGDSHEDWDETRLFEMVKKGDNMTVSELNCRELNLSVDWIDDELNMGDPLVLGGFLDYAKACYSWDSVYLDIWNHGGGWRSGPTKEVALDDESSDALFMPEIAAVLQETQISFDVVLFDACVMGYLETAAALLGSAQTACFSQESIPADGFPYESVIPRLFLEDVSVEAKAASLCRIFESEYGGEKSFSAVRIDARNALDALLSVLESEVPMLDKTELVSPWETAVNTAQSGKDLSVFFTLSPEIQEAFNNVLIEKVDGVLPLCGLSIYFPEMLIYDSFASDFNSQVPLLNDFPSWQDFLEKWYTYEEEWLDTLEPNGTREQASLLDETVCESYLWNGEDRDFYTLDLSRLYGQDLTVSLSVPEDCDFDLKVYIYRNDTVLRRVSDSLTGVPEQILLTDEDIQGAESLYVEIVSPYDHYSRQEPYTLSFSIQ